MPTLRFSPQSWLKPDPFLGVTPEGNIPKDGDLEARFNMFLEFWGHCLRIPYYLK